MEWWYLDGHPTILFDDELDAREYLAVLRDMDMDDPGFDKIFENTANLIDYLPELRHHCDEHGLDPNDYYTDFDEWERENNERLHDDYLFDREREQ